MNTKAGGQISSARLWEFYLPYSQGGFPESFEGLFLEKEAKQIDAILKPSLQQHCSAALRSLILRLTAHRLSDKIIVIAHDESFGSRNHIADTGPGFPVLHPRGIHEVHQHQVCTFLQFGLFQDLSIELICHTDAELDLLNCFCFCCLPYQIVPILVHSYDTHISYLLFFVFSKKHIATFILYHS